MVLLLVPEQRVATHGVLSMHNMRGGNGRVPLMQLLLERVVSKTFRVMSSIALTHNSAAGLLAFPFGIDISRLTPLPNLLTVALHLPSCIAALYSLFSSPIYCPKRSWKSKPIP